jgi:hypothetical protein
MPIRLWCCLATLLGPLPSSLNLVQHRCLQSVFHLLLTEKVKSFIRILFGLIQINLRYNLRGGIPS